jgi:hypothetical protein
LGQGVQWGDGSADVLGGGRERVAVELHAGAHDRADVQGSCREIGGVLRHTLLERGVTGLTGSKQQHQSSHQSTFLGALV